MKKLYRPALSLCLFCTVLVSCNKKDDFQSDQLADYFALQKGKYIRYYLDSTLYVNFGQEDSVVHYQAKDVIEDSVTDNSGRTGWRVVRYLREAQSTDESAWLPSLTYVIIPTRESLELQEDNLRFLKLKLPISLGYSWRGNSFLPSSPYAYAYQFSNDADMPFWDYTYDGIGETVSINGNDYENTVTVTQVADSVNVPITYPEGLAFRNYWMEQYSKGIGLVYKEVVMWEWQPPNGGSPGYKTGFGVKMSIIDHN